MSRPDYRLMDMEILHRLAHIFGPESASAKALQDWKRRKDEGQDPLVVQAGSAFLVVNRQALQGDPS